MKFFCPGRVNLLGEHLDYNGGWTLPIAINLGITLELNERHDSLFGFSSDNHPSVNDLEISGGQSYTPQLGWANYPIGIISKLIGNVKPLCGYHFHYQSSLPEGSGLSSSAAIEAVTAYSFLKAHQQEPDKMWLASVCKEVENEFIGVGCGIMDQLAVCASVENHALLIKCDHIETGYIPFETDRYQLLIMDTQKPRKLKESKYNERLEECRQVLRIFQTHTAIEHLAHADMMLTETLRDPILKRRAQHVISEQLRVMQAIKSLKYNDLFAVGKLFDASHRSLQNLYEVTGPELDCIVDAAQAQTGCLGARMTGAGFGGCAIALVDQNTITEFTDKVSKIYETQTGYTCKFYQSGAESGVRALN